MKNAFPKSMGTSFALVAAILLVRLITLASSPFIDPSEARFASASAQMEQSGDWITPRIHFGQEEWINYWAKPPLQVWITAVSFKLFGINEWASRIPAFFDLTLVALLLVLFTRVIGKRSAGPVAAAIFLSSLGIFIFAFACITDPTLTATVSIAIVSFALVTHYREQPSLRRRWSHLFFLALAIGMLTKGPVTVVLVGGSLFFWLLLRGAWTELALLSWVPGIIIFIALSAPWYIAAEHATPGFLYYFFVQENFKRYLSHDFGILYGSAHQQPRGTIWILLLGVSFPWCLLLLGLLKSGSKTWWHAIREDRWLSLALCWGIFPPLFFTFARQILATYIFPAMPGLALAAALLLQHKNSVSIYRFSAFAIGGVAFLISCAALPVDIYFRQWMLLIAGVVATCVIVGCVYEATKKAPAEGSLYLALALAISVSSCLTAAAPIADEYLSSKHFAQIVREHLPPGQHVIAELFRDVHSLRLYGATQEPSFSIISDLRVEQAFEQQLEHNISLVAVRDADMPRVADSFMARCSLIADAGPWLLFSCDKTEPEMP